MKNVAFTKFSEFPKYFVKLTLLSLFSKTVAFTKFLPKNCESSRSRVKFHNFSFFHIALLCNVSSFWVQLGFNYLGPLISFLFCPNFQRLIILDEGNVNPNVRAESEENLGSFDLYTDNPYQCHHSSPHYSHRCLNGHLLNLRLRNCISPLHFQRISLPRMKIL